MIRTITEALFSELPKDTLYHYTSLSGVLGIIGSRSLWASDIRYMNDSAELRHTADLVSSEVARRINEGHPRPYLLTCFLDWVRHRITNGHILFGASFRSNGNLLSQWRGYSAVGKGASLGFNPVTVAACAEKQQFRMGRCIYDRQEQLALINKVLDSVEVLADGIADGVEREIYHQLFEHLESDLLRLAAILKHPSFEEEQEWRLVSPVVSDYQHASVNFREGRSMLVPYIKFSLVSGDNGAVDLDHVYLGPTPNISLSMNSMKMCLAKHGIRPDRGIEYCQIPYRQN
ncbi:Uncharacterised protein [Zhongshania aliphaticivorans]|uniref:DUF2971 domain-containing protein n=1 Tax=Zhongshania aliphaticivorans TaxID=1470434 RepID=A0A5S9ND78_9GAMM|nr:DUF2971 domain-containing protein [Zhongshania aliphaticivorans]CAA0087642.1 Uncharacterised protein [Zhongshania aliphaticivorans]CAA0115263.1 Uncharacterised protein [Zhongshania aliphaticivorans]CAA0120102.1 Uncharacterised protein [Zhongshania aliphaticivorans]